eukprot:363499-Chlamydomonas_euryale.AAC.4
MAQLTWRPRYHPGHARNTPEGASSSPAVRKDMGQSGPTMQRPPHTKRSAPSQLSYMRGCREGPSTMAGAPAGGGGAAGEEAPVAAAACGRDMAGAQRLWRSDSPRSAAGVRSSATNKTSSAAQRKWPLLGVVSRLPRRVTPRLSKLLQPLSLQQRRRRRRTPQPSAVEALYAAADAVVAVAVAEVAASGSARRQSCLVSTWQKHCWMGGMQCTWA